MCCAVSPLSSMVLYYAEKRWKKSKCPYYSYIIAISFLVAAPTFISGNINYNFQFPITIAHYFKGKVSAKDLLWLFEETQQQQTPKQHKHTQTDETISSGLVVGCFTCVLHKSLRKNFSPPPPHNNTHKQNTNRGTTLSFLLLSSRYFILEYSIVAWGQ